MVVEEILAWYATWTPDIKMAETVAASDYFWVPMIGFNVLYILMLYYFPAWQKKHRVLMDRPIARKMLFVCWNLFLSTYSVLAFVFFLCHTIKRLGEIGSLSPWICQEGVDTFEFPALFWSYTFAVSKYFELVDTFLLLLKKPERDPKFLHTYHHVTVLITAFYGFRSEFTGFMFGALMNTFIHSFMYFYYALTEFFKPGWGILLTLAQITQMIVGTGMSFYWCYLEITQGCSCKSPVPMIIMIITIYTSYLYLFLKFFVGRYLVKRPREDGKVKKVNEGEQKETPKKDQ